MSGKAKFPIIVIIVGIPGVGKTTVLKKLQEKASKEGLDVKVVNFGDYMFEEARSRGLISHRDEIRKLPIHIQLDLQEKAAKKIREDAEKEKHDIFIVDTHALIHTATGFWPGLPKHVIENIKPYLIVNIEASPEEIYARRMRDASVRFRMDERSIEEIREFMFLARVSSIASAVLTGSTVKFVQNREGKVEEAVDEILNALRNI